MYALPYAWMLKVAAPGEFWAMIGRSAAEFDMLTPKAIVMNLAAVTAGNFVGGALLVGIVYWFIYLRS
jgi:formate transporter